LKHRSLTANQCYPLTGICTDRLTFFCSALKRNQRRWATDAVKC
jgi:hypothetical protein